MDFIGHELTNRNFHFPYWGLESTFPEYIWAASCEKGPDDTFCPFLVSSFFAHFIPQIT